MIGVLFIIMLRKYFFAFILIVLVIIILSYAVFLKYKLISEKKNTMTNISSSTSSTRGWFTQDTTDAYYHFPVIVLSDPSEVNGIYKMKVSPFNSLTEEFELLLGSKTTQVPFGSCTFTEKGEFLGKATWTLRNISYIATKIQIGDSILVRLSYPLHPTIEQEGYSMNIKKQIDNLEHKKQLGMFVPTALCKD